MKYRYNPVYILLMVLSWAAFGFGIAYFLLRGVGSKMPSDILFRRNTIHGVIVILAVFTVRYVPEYLNRYVVVDADHLLCSSFRIFLGRKLLNPRILRLRYENISKIEYKKSLGLFPCLYVYETSMHAPVKIPFTFRKFKQLSMDLCSHVLDRNPKAEISKKLVPHT